MASTYSDTINFYKNYKTCESLCEAQDALWLFTAVNPDDFHRIAHLIRKEHLVEPSFLELKRRYKSDPGNCFALDMDHPGIIPNKVMCENLWQRLTMLYPEKLVKLQQRLRECQM